MEVIKAHNHYLPNDQWAMVVAEAARIRQEIQDSAQGGAASGITPLTDLTQQGIASKKYFGVSGIPTQLLVVHSGESPLQGGFARSLTNWASTIYPQAPIASWHWFQDPLEMVAFIPPELGAWHASEANVLSEGFEQSGYARFSRAEWLTPDGKTQLESLAYYMAQRAIANDIPAVWLTNDQVTRATGGNRSIKGLCFHRQIDPETRTDPGNGYPADLLLERIKFYMDGGTDPVEEEDDVSAQDVMSWLVTRPDGSKLRVADIFATMSVDAAETLKLVKGMKAVVEESMLNDRKQVEALEIILKAIKTGDASKLEKIETEGITKQVADELAKRLAD